jgi:CBS domain-containing protein
MKVAALVGGHVETIEATASLRNAARSMVQAGIGSLLVSDEERIAGMITERDLAVAIAHDADLDSESVGDWMSDAPELALPDWEVEHAADVMLEHGFRHLPVVVGTKAIGMVSVKDLVWAMRGVEHRSSH